LIVDLKFTPVALGEATHFYHFRLDTVFSAEALKKSEHRSDCVLPLRKVCPAGFGLERLL
jgi:hypothetical protein